MIPTRLVSRHIALIFWLLVIISILLVLPVHAGNAGPAPASTSTLLFPAIIYPAGALAESLAVADINGDGNPDLLVADYSGGADVLLGNGDGTFLPRCSMTQAAAASFPSP